MLQHPGVRPDERQASGQAGFNGDLLTKQSPQPQDGPFDKAVQIEILQVHRLLTAEDQQLAEQAGRPFTCGGDLIQGFEGLGRGILGVQEQARVAGDDREQIVEFVRNASRHLRERFHLLALPPGDIRRRAPCNRQCRVPRRITPDPGRWKRLGPGVLHAFSTGRLTWLVVPAPALLSRFSSPPKCRASLRTSVSPSPSPGSSESMRLDC